MWYTKLSFRRLAVQVKDNRLGARVVVVPANTGDTPGAWVRSQESWVYVSDSVSVALDRVLTLDETLELLDETGSAYGWVLTAEDTVEPTDETALEIVAYLESSATLQDSQALNMGNGQTLNLDDPVSLSDAPALELTLEAEDSVSLSDALTWLKGFELSLQDSVTLDDALTQQWVLTLDHSVTLTDAVAKSQTLTLQGSTQGYVDLGYFASDYVESAGGDLVFVTDSIA